MIWVEGPVKKKLLGENTVKMCFLHFRYKCGALVFTVFTSYFWFCRLNLSHGLQCPAGLGWAVQCLALKGKKKNSNFQSNIKYTNTKGLILCLWASLRTLPGKMMEEVSLNIAKYNIHALVIIGGFEVRLQFFVLVWYFIQVVGFVNNCLRGRSTMKV